MFHPRVKREWSFLLLLFVLFFCMDKSSLTWRISAGECEKHWTVLWEFYSLLIIFVLFCYVWIYMKPVWVYFHPKPNKRSPLKDVYLEIFWGVIDVLCFSCQSLDCRESGVSCEIMWLFGRIADESKVTLIFSSYVKIFVHILMSNDLDLIVWFVNKRLTIFTSKTDFVFILFI